jgi:DNA mismatch repair protein MutS
MDVVPLPPMLRNYLEYKQSHPDCLLLFQVGDFYEVFFEDAIITARALNLTLTSRDKNNPNPIPMCGVPIAVVDGYAERLVEQGFSVALVSQVGEPDPKKGMVERRLERIVTPGIRVLAGPEGEKQSEARVLAVGGVDLTELAVSVTDVKSGKVLIRQDLNLENLEWEIKRLNPREVIFPRQIADQIIDRRVAWVRRIEAALGPGSSVKFRSAVSRPHRELNVAGIVTLNSSARRSLQLLIDYLDEVTVEGGVSIREVALEQLDGRLMIDAATRDHLELVQNSRDGSTHATLFGLMDYTASPAGRRLLRQWILSPLADVAAITARQQAVRILLAHPTLRAELTAALRGVSDIERIATRIELSVGTPRVSPRELGALRDSLGKALTIRNLLLDTVNNLAVAQFADDVTQNCLTTLAHMHIPEDIRFDLESALVDAPPLTLGDQQIFKNGYDAELDRLQGLQSSGKEWMLRFEAEERERSGINSLKVKYNSVFGYFIEITAANLAKAPTHYIRKQTTANGERYYTPELKAMEEELTGAVGKVQELERVLFRKLVEKIKPSVNALRDLSDLLAVADCLAAFAEVALKENLVEPALTNTLHLKIVKGRHPVLANLSQGAIVANSVEFARTAETPPDLRAFVLTGPNMGGKSTYLRQTALIVIMAQMGSFVPAEAAAIGLVDKILSRMGASDSLSEGESTFMVEMREMAHILASATERSLLLIDEVGRGTATTDGLSLAQAILERIIHKIQCRTLFATHFHELTALAIGSTRVGNLCVGSIEEEGDIIFTHEIRAGAASRSYGLEVAKRAGLPEGVLTRARELHLETLRAATAQSITAQSKRDAHTSQLGLFSAPTALHNGHQEERVVERIVEKLVEPADTQGLRELRNRLSVIDPNMLTPLEALQKLFDLKQGVKTLPREG